MEVDTWVVAHNQVGRTESDHIKKIAQCFGEFKIPMQWLDFCRIVQYIHKSVAVPWCWLACLIFFCDCLAVKMIPPFNVKAFSEKNSPTTLHLSWTPPYPDECIYEIRFCANGSPSWSNASTFMYHLKTCNLIVSFKISSVKHLVFILGAWCSSGIYFRQCYSVLDIAESSTRHNLHHSSSLSI